MKTNKESFKKFVTYAITLMMMLSIMAIPLDSYGLNGGKMMVALKTFNGKYLCAENGGGSTLTANRDKIGEWETFQLIDLGKGYIALKGSNGDYVSVSNDGKDVYVDRDEINRKETFRLVRLNNNKVALEAYNDHYLCAEDGGGGKVVADREKVGSWETFELIEIQDDQVDFEKCKLTATPEDRSISFTWTKPSSTKNIIGYNLYRGTASGRQSSTPVTDFPIEGTSYTDKNVESETTYYYVVKVVYKNKTLGPASNEVKVVLKSRITLSAKTEEEGVRLLWNKQNDTNNIIGYNLYRGTASGKQSSTPVTDFPIEGMSYIDKNIENNTTYYYILKAVYRDKTLGSASNEVAVKSGSMKKNIILEVGSKYMFVNGQRKEIDPGKGTTMIIKDGRTFLPIRSVIEAMGGEVEWNASDKRVDIYLKNNKIYLWIGSKTARVNGVSRESDVAPYISDSGRTMLPLRFIVENLGCEADWDGVTKSVTIKMPK
ncbi:stalk domain-containing protein [Anaerosolibacter sp.]|uniref:stalk domain-containing protein n=1 Tax=Anaerosolibacter sp. TaxID=1872527 RepID=UPI0039EF9EDD